jgi:predicted permease
MTIGERHTSRPGGPADLSVGNFVDLAREQTSFATLAAVYYSNLNLADAGATPERVVGARVTADYFTVFSVAPALGRGFTAEESRAGGPAVVVLSDRLWRRRFGADRTIVGRTITLNGTAATVIGVMPPSFDWSQGTEELWLPAGFTPAQEAEHDNHFLAGYGRLEPGVSVERARAEIDRLMLREVERFPTGNANVIGGFVAPMFELFVGSARERLLVLLGAVGFVLLIGCANVANLLLARGAGRLKELGLRAALGAGRGRIVRQLFTESVVLAVLAGVLGSILAVVGLKLLVAGAPTSVPRLDRAAVDGTALLFALGVSVGSALLFGLVPALRLATPTLTSFLREGGRGSSEHSRDWLRRGLIAAEVAIALVLLVGAGLLIRTAVNLSRVDPGYDPSGVLSARITLPVTQSAEWQQVTDAFSRIVEEAKREPGVTDAGIASQVPSGPGGSSNGLIPEGRPLEPASAIPARLRLVTPGYLRAMRIRLEAGRDFTADDRRDRTRVMIVNRAFVKAAWPGVTDPIGKRVACCEPDAAWKEVIGVVDDVRWQGPAQDATPEFYLPIGQAPAEAWNWLQRSMTLVARTNGDPLALERSLREAVGRVDPALPLYEVATMDQRLAGSVAESRFNTGLLGLLGAIGLTLSAIGIYGVVAYFVARRTRELGIRMALGASAGRIRALVIRQGLGPVGIGIAIGAVLALWLTRILTSQLRGVAAGDPLTLALVAGGLASVALVASVIPARRATRVDTATAMREE